MGKKSEVTLLLFREAVQFLPKHAQVRHIIKSATLSWQCAFYRICFQMSK